MLKATSHAASAGQSTQANLGASGSGAGGAASTLVSSTGLQPTSMKPYDGGKRLRLGPMARHRIYKESGEPLRTLRLFSAFHASASSVGAAANSALASLGVRGNRSKLGDLVEAVVNGVPSSSLDAVDPNYRTYTGVLPAHGVKQPVSLAVGKDAKGVHVSTFPYQIRNTVGLKLSIHELQQRGWTFHYGAKSAFDSKAGRVEIGRGDDAADVNLRKAIDNHAFPGGSRTTPALIQHAYDLLAPAYPAFFENAEAPGQSGLYDLLHNRVSVANPSPAAVVVAAYRYMYGPLNQQLRSMDANARKLFDPVARRIGEALQEFPTFDGFVTRGEKLRDDQIDLYRNRIGKVIEKDGIMSATTEEEPPEGFGSNATFHIRSHTGRHIGNLSPHNEVDFEHKENYRVLDVKETKPANWASFVFPKVEIFLEQVQPSQGISARTGPGADTAGANTDPGTGVGLGN
jgi:hypothetical protein